MKMKLVLVSCASLVVVAVLLSAQEAALDAEYQTRAAALKADDSQAHFALAKWAYRKGFYRETVAECDKLLALDNGDTRAKYLKAACSGSTPAVAVSTAVAVTAETAEPPPPTRAANVVSLTKEQVDELYKRYGAKSMGEFTATIQPILIRSCATDNCHGNAEKSGTFYIKTQRPTERNTIAENFKSLEAYINLDKPANSRILEIVRGGKEVHKGTKTPLFASDNDPTFRVFKQWVSALPPTSKTIWDK